MAKYLTYKDINKSILKSIKNPTKEDYEVKISAPEFTFLGEDKQPDFGRVYITFYPDNKVIELKSLKQYFYQFRDIRVSYERVINCMYDNLMEIYNPARLRLVIEFFPRGGISSRLVIDSDWKTRGGDETFWHHDDIHDWSFNSRVI